MDNGPVQPFKSLMAELENQAKQEQKKWEALSEEEKQRILDKERRKEEEKKKEGLIASYQAQGIPPRFYDASWENWVSDTEVKTKAFQTVKNEAWRTNLFLCGKSGTGKTHLAMCLTKDGAKYRRLPDIFREVRADFNSEQNVIDYYGAVTLLIIDEVGRQKFSDFEKNLFFEIIDKRWSNMLPTTLITNLNEKEFFAEYGTAILDRLRPKIVRFNWDSIRGSLDIKIAPPAAPAKEGNIDDIDF